MKKRINKILWYGDELQGDKAKSPSIAINADGLDGLNEGELFIANNEKDPAIFIRTSSGKIVRIGGADLEVLKELFLSKVSDDEAEGVIDFKKGVKFGQFFIDSLGNAVLNRIEAEEGITTNGTILSNGLEIGKFIEEGDIIQGAQVTKEGVGSFAGLKSPYMQIYELILNRKTAVQGEFAFSDGDTVEGVTLNEDGTYTLALREQYEGYMTSFKKDDIVYANINIIGGSDYSDDSDNRDDSDNSSNSSYRGVTTGKCWMRVNGVAEDGLSLNVSLYADNQVPSGKNIAPQPYMMITRHGNETDKTRQDVWVISSEDGRMYQLTGVDSPTINSTTAYATVWGKLPQNLVEYIQQHVTNFNANQPYLYARGAVIQDLILLNYKGAIIKTENYRGAWSRETAVNDPYITNETTYDTVTHNGSKWMVQASGTTVEPSETVTEWTIVTAKGESGVSYSLKPSPSTVQVFKNQSKSVLSLDVTVVESGENVIELTEQDELDERGLKVQFALDGQGERYDLEIGGVYAIEDENGEAVFVDEAYEGEDDILYFEGQAIDLSQVQYNITIYLVKNGKDIAEQRVPVVKDGKDGIDGIDGKDGTSIKIAGEFASEEALNAAFPEGDGENCYLIGTDVWVWDGEKWINAGQFKGDGAVRIDLDNQTDTMIYDNDGKLLSGEVKSNIRLYDGHDLVENATFTLYEPTDVTAYVEGNVLRITECYENQGYAQVACEYRGTTYYATMTVKKIVNGAKYEIVTNPTSVTYNETKDELSHNTVSIEIYKSAQDATGKFVREKLSTLPTGHLVAVLPSTGGSITVDYNSGATVTVDKSWESFTVLLVDDYKNARLDEETVPVIHVKDGDNGENGHSYTLQASVNTVSSLVDATDGKIMKTEAFSIDFTYCIDNEPYTLTTSDLLSSDGFGEDIPARALGVSEGKARLFLSIKGGVTPETKNITVTVTPLGLPTATTSIAISHPQRGLVGPAGETGAMLYPAGYWDANTVYTQVKDEEGKAVATPFVYYQNKQGAGDYYVLQQDLPNAGIDPSTDDSQTYWKKFQPIQYLFTEALMANWARLAKSVFWGDYMFSTKGVNQAGEVIDHTAYMGTDNPMFDSETNRLTGALIPNLFLDLENGMVKTNKLSETFRPFRTYEIEGGIYDYVADRLSLNNSYNIKASIGRKLICMPLMSDILLWTEEVSDGVYEGVVVQSSEYEIDGVHSSVVVAPDMDYEKGVTSYLSSGSEIYKDKYGWPNVCSKCVLVCSDPRIFNKYSYKYGLQGYPSAMYAPANKIVKSEFGESADMFFSVNGTLTKWLLLEAGTMAKLRLMESEGLHYWLVENAGDFEQLDVKVLVNVNICADYQSGGLKLLDETKSFYLGGIIGDGSSSSIENNSDYGTDEGRLSRFYGSKRLRQLYDKSPNTGSISFLINGENEDYIDDIE